MISSPETERIVLGVILLDPAMVYEAFAKLTPDDFSLSANRDIFASMGVLSDRKDPIDTQSLADVLRAQGKLQECGDWEYLSTLTDGVPRSKSISYHCGIVREKAIMRSLLALSEKIGATAEDPAAKSKSLIASIQEYVLRLQTCGGEARLIRDVMQEAVDRLSEQRNTPETETIGLTTTLPDVDVGTTGIRESELWVIGSRPNVGKTPYGMQVAIAQAKKNIPVLVFSIEMDDVQIALRCISHAGMAKPRHVRDPHYAGPASWKNIITAPDVVKDWPLWIDDTPGITMQELKHKARYAIARHKIRLVVVDYIGLVKTTGRSEYDRVTETASGLRLLARETRCPVLALCQLNREAKDLSKEPNLGDLRSSGEIEQSAHVVGLLHRPPDPTQEGEMLGKQGLFIIAKAREGVPGKTKVTFQSETLTFKGGWE